MQESNTLETRSAHQPATPLFMTVPLENHFLPVKSPPLVTTGLWRRMLGAGGREFYQERVDALCFYATFALLGLVGFDREHRQNSDTLLMPVVIEDDRFAIRLTIHRRTNACPVLTFSLPEEAIPVTF